MKYAANITNKAYSLSLTAGKTYNLYFDCGTTDGIIQGVTATQEGVTANLDKTYAKITVGKYGAMSGDTTTSGNWVRTANNEYTAYGTNHENAYTTAQIGTGEKFVVSVRIKGASNMQAGISLITGGSTKDLQIFRNGKDTDKKFTIYSWGAGWVTSGFVADGVAYDVNDFTLTLVWYNKELKMYINNIYSATFSGTIKSALPFKESSVTSVDFNALGSVTVGMSLRGTYTKTVKFSDWSYSAADSDITEYISAHNS